MGTRGSKRLRALPPKGALIDAAKKGDGELVASLLDMGADIHEVDNWVRNRKYMHVAGDWASG